MQLLLQFTRLPELATCSPSARQKLVQRAFALLRSDTRFGDLFQVVSLLAGAMLGVVAGVFFDGCFFPAKSVREAIPVAMYCNVVGAVLGCWAGLLVGFRLQARKLRPYLRKAIEERERATKA
jgi:hypothetical protein